MTEYSWEYGDVPYTKNLEKFHAELIDDINSKFIQNNSISAKKVQKFKYSEIINRRIAEKIQKSPGEFVVQADYDLIIIWEQEPDGAYTEALFKFDTFNEFLEWLDTND